MEISEMSLFSITPSKAFTIEYMDSETIDVNVYEHGDKAEILDFNGVLAEDILPVEMENDNINVSKENLELAEE